MPDPTATDTDKKSTASGTLIESAEGKLILSIPETNYLIELEPKGPIDTPIGQRISGVITARARRVDPIKSGGLFIDPVRGRPRRVQGRIIATDPTSRTITVNAGVPLVVKTDARQDPSIFTPGQLVCFDIKPGAAFTPSI